MPLCLELTMTELARLFLSEFWRHHAPLEQIMSNQNSRFQGKFWKLLMD